MVVSGFICAAYRAMRSMKGRLYTQRSVVRCSGVAQAKNA